MPQAVAAAIIGALGDAAVPYALAAAIELASIVLVNVALGAAEFEDDDGIHWVAV